MYVYCVLLYSNDNHKYKVVFYVLIKKNSQLYFSDSVSGEFTIPQKKQKTKEVRDGSPKISDNLGPDKFAFILRNVSYLS